MARDEAYRKAIGAIESANRAGLSKLDINGVTTRISEKLTELPSSLGRLAKLEELYLHSNRLESLPDSIGQLSELQILFLSNNRLTTLPKSLGLLTALHSLHLFNNELGAVPETLCLLRHLQTLDVSANQLTSLPDSLGSLSQLQTLDVSSNQMTALPDSIGELKELRTLDVSGNKLTSLPESLRGLENLRNLYLHMNPGLGLPDEVLGPTAQDVNSRNQKPKSPEEILDYYFRVQGHYGRSLAECKLIVVGRGGVGKTSLIKRLSGRPYDRDERETHGIAIQKVHFNGENGAITSRVWDFGGQVVLHSMHEFFLTARSLYLLVVGERDDMLERDVAYWLQLVRSYAGNAPVVVAMNKSAGRQRQFDHATLEQNYGPILGWVATECSEGDEDKAGITELRQALTMALDSAHMESIRRKFPTKWFAIKDALEQMTESFLDYDGYVKKCESHGEHDPQEQAALAADLHDLGIALNYGRDPRLRDTSVLRPDWLANGIYAVLRANDLDAAHLPDNLNVPLALDGIVTADSMARIHAKAEAWKMLRVADYPDEKREFLLHLMGLFHLSFRVDDEGKHLVPALLPLHPPVGADEPKDTGCVRLRYEFQVVPAPIVPWFIARTFSLIPQRLHWRRGAILAFGDARARVWTTPDERYIFVTTGGTSQDRNELLTMIRVTFDDLFSDYRGLRVTEQWEHDGEWVPRKTLERFNQLSPNEQNPPQS